MVLDAHPHVAGDLGEPARCRMGVGRVDVALPQVRRLHHVEVTVADDVVAQPHEIDPPGSLPLESVSTIRSRPAGDLGHCQGVSGLREGRWRQG